MITNGPCNTMRAITPVSKGNLTTCQPSDRTNTICTAIYAPVCGILNDQSMVTYSSACTACGNSSVMYWFLKIVNIEWIIC